MLESSTSKDRVPDLDALRALAIISVVLFHFGLEDGAFRISFFHAFGWTGVDLFFVLSGFLIGGQLFDLLKSNGHISIGEFYFRRAFRILPAYWTVLFLYWSWPEFRERHDFAPIWRFLTFIHNLNLDRTIYKTFSQAWSLCVEEHFYLVFPLLTVFANGTGGFDLQVMVTKDGTHDSKNLFISTRKAPAARRGIKKRDGLFHYSGRRASLRAQLRV